MSDENRAGLVHKLQILDARLGVLCASVGATVDDVATNPDGYGYELVMDVEALLAEKLAVLEDLGEILTKEEKAKKIISLDFFRKKK